MLVSKESINKASQEILFVMCIWTFPKSLITFYWTLFLGLKQTRVSKEELKQTKANVQANKQKTQINIRKKVAYKKNK
jgi:hypothetical protein